MAVLARLSRTVPLLLFLAFVAAVIYLVVMFRASPNRAKEVLINIFTWLMGGLSVIFALLTLYAIGESNTAVAELWGTFLATTLIGLLITRLCRHQFVKHHPHYEFKASKAHIIRRLPWPFDKVKFPWEK